MGEYTWPDGFRELLKTHEAQRDELQSRIADLERQVAAGEARWATLQTWIREECDEWTISKQGGSKTAAHYECVLGRVSSEMDKFNRQPTADCVRVVVNSTGRETGSNLAVVQGGVLDIEPGTDAYLVRLKGVDRG